MNKDCCVVDLPEAMSALLCPSFDSVLSPSAANQCPNNVPSPRRDKQHSRLKRSCEVEAGVEDAADKRQSEYMFQTS